MTKLTEITKQACVIKSQAKAKELYDQRHKEPHKYKEDEYVMASNVDTTVGVSKKLIPKYCGLF